MTYTYQISPQREYRPSISCPKKFLDARFPDCAPNYRTQVYKHRPDIVPGGVYVPGEVYRLPTWVH